MNPIWIDADAVPELPDEVVHVWSVTLSSIRPRLDFFRAILDDGERERAGRARSEMIGERLCLTRGLLRFLLGAYLHSDPGSLRFHVGESGKPRLADGATLGFNLSHSGDRAVFAFGRGGEVGVDVEQVRGEAGRWMEVARRHFAPGEQAALSQAPESDRLRTFFKFWTCKEAFVKAHGGGVFSGLDQFEVCLDGPRLLAVHGHTAEAADWFLARLPQEEDYLGAVVARQPVRGLHCLRWNAR